MTSKSDIMSKEALAFVSDLHRKFNPTREALLAKRVERQIEFDQGNFPTFLNETKSIREGEWRVAETKSDLNDRRVEITGPVERKMMINAFNSGAKVFMADFEDSLSPTWDNIVEGQVNLYDAVRRTITFTNPEGKHYELNDSIATLVVRSRGWHLLEKNFKVDGEAISASLFDFGLYFFHNAKELLKNGSGPYLYLPKLESHLEARLWNDVFIYAQDTLGIPQGSIRATVLIETILAAFEMEEILYELRDHSSGLNAGRWDYIFSLIKKFRHEADYSLPDRDQITMTVPFMRAYTELLVSTCHRRGAHALGGMSAFIPNRREPEITKIALEKVREDKTREANDGFDGTWVAHPDLVVVAQEEFDKVLGDAPNQKERLRDDVHVDAKDLIDLAIPNSTVTETGVRKNISVALQYINAWLSGIGAAAINNLMEDAATAEISRAQLWQWVNNKHQLEDGRPLTSELYAQLLDSEVEKLADAKLAHEDDAVDLLNSLVLNVKFDEFLTTKAYEKLK